MSDYGRQFDNPIVIIMSIAIAGSLLAVAALIQSTEATCQTDYTYCEHDLH